MVPSLLSWQCQNYQATFESAFAKCEHIIRPSPSHIFMTDQRLLSLDCELMTSNAAAGEPEQLVVRHPSAALALPLATVPTIRNMGYPACPRPAVQTHHRHLTVVQTVQEQNLNSTTTAHQILSPNIQSGSRATLSPLMVNTRRSTAGSIKQRYCTRPPGRRWAP
jgi:hypothetical protein